MSPSERTSHKLDRKFVSTGNNKYDLQFKVFFLLSSLLISLTKKYSDKNATMVKR